MLVGTWHKHNLVSAGIQDVSNYKLMFVLLECLSGFPYQQVWVCLKLRKQRDVFVKPKVSNSTNFGLQGQGHMVKSVKHPAFVKVM